MKISKKSNELKTIEEELENINDIERIAGKIGLNRVNARDMKALEQSIASTLSILDILQKEVGISYKEIDKKFLRDIVSKISKTILEDPSLSITEGGVIKEDYNKEVDELRSLSGNSKSWIKDFEQKEKKKTGILYAIFAQCILA